MCDLSCFRCDTSIGLSVFLFLERDVSSRFRSASIATATLPLVEVRTHCTLVSTFETCRSRMTRVYLRSLTRGCLAEPCIHGFEGITRASARALCSLTGKTCHSVCCRSLCHSQNIPSRCLSLPFADHKQLAVANGITLVQSDIVQCTVFYCVCHFSHRAMFIDLFYDRLMP